MTRKPYTHEDLAAARIDPDEGLVPVTLTSAESADLLAEFARVDGLDEEIERLRATNRALQRRLSSDYMTIRDIAHAVGLRGHPTIAAIANTARRWRTLAKRGATT